MHDTAPIDEAYVPAPQPPEQALLVRPVVLPNTPIGHGVEEEEPPTQNCPTEQRAQEPLAPEQLIPIGCADAYPGLQEHATSTGVIVGVKEGDRNCVGLKEGVAYVETLGDDVVLI